MYKIFIGSLILQLMAASSSFAKECDNFSGRNRDVKDSLEALDSHTNQLMNEAVVAVNTSSKGCDEGRLYALLGDKIAGSPIGQLEKWAEDSQRIEKLVDQQEGPDSIYDGMSFWHYPLMAATSFDHSIRLAGHVVGIDKLGHFMGEGYSYFRMMRKDNGSLERAMLWGIHTEEGIFGLSVSGIKSYADLAANYAGAQFWLSVLGGKDPYFVCRNDRFEKVRRFTWADHVTAAWDEAINCSQFSSHMLNVVTKNLAKKGMTCPVSGTEQICADLAHMPDAKGYISPVCLNNPGLASKIFDPRILRAVPTSRRGD